MLGEGGGMLRKVRGVWGSLGGVGEVVGRSGISCQEVGEVSHSYIL
jgi:hypothetical protein